MRDPLAVAALVIGLTVGVGLSVVTIVMCCLWYRTRNQLKILKRRVEYEAVVGKKDKLQISTQLTEYPTEPPPGTHTFEQSLPSPIEPRVHASSSNYSAVNNLAILPDEVRTPENLEAGQLPSDKEKADQLVSEYVKQKKDYEETQLAKLAPKEASSPPSSSPRGVTSTKMDTSPSQVTPPRVLNKTPGYEDIDPVELTGYQQIEPTKQPSPKSRIGDYNNPVDYLPADHPMMDPIAFTTASSSPQRKKAFVLSTSAEEYTEVFDSLPPGEVSVVGLPKVRAMSDSNSSRRKIRTDSNGSPSHADAVYQNGLRNDSSSRPGGSLDNVNGFGERMDSIRQSKRDSAKEFVELDLNKRRFRVTGAKRETLNKGRESTDGEELEGSKKFDLSEDDCKESYAVVNLADKQRYRTESDSMKKEGSGAPKHYGPEEKAVETA